MVLTSYVRATVRQLFWPGLLLRPIPMASSQYLIAGARNRSHIAFITMGHDVRNCQRPFIPEIGADKKTRIFGYL